MTFVRPANACDAPSPRNRSGFALIATISILVLLALIAVGLLSLSTVSIRGSNSEAAQNEARANARMALIIAIGELQRQAGPDQRITAAADILSAPGSSAPTGNPRWTGVWGSWTAGTDNEVDEPSAHATIATSGSPGGMHPTYRDGREDHFRGWLVSGKRAELSKLATATASASVPRAFPGKTDNSVRLVGPGSLGESTAQDQYVAAALLDMKNKGTIRGRMGWWVGDESLKAPITPDPYTGSGGLSNALAIERSQAPPQAAAWQIDGLDHLSDSDTAERLYSYGTLNVAAGDPETPKPAFHDASPWTFGVLADVREGGLKRDLSAILDRPISSSDDGDEFMLYKFAEGAEERVPLQDLAAYYQLYREHLATGSVALSGSEQVVFPDYQNEPFSRTYSGLYRMPVPVKIQFLLSRIGALRTNAEKNRNPDNKDPYKLHIGITPAITLWNPYSVPLVMEAGPLRAMQLRYFNLPLTISWNKNEGQFISKKTSLAWLSNREIEGNDGNDRFTGFTGWLAGTRPVIFQPGEVRVFSLESNQRNIFNRNRFVPRLEMVSGWDPENYIELTRSAADGTLAHVDQEPGAWNNQNRTGGPLTFKDGDRISFTVAAEGTANLANGSALQFFLRQGVAVDGDIRWNDRSYQLISRVQGRRSEFNLELMKQAFPDGAEEIAFKPIPGAQMKSGNAQPFLLVSLTAGSEVSGEFANEEDGRRFTSRPFLHSTAIHAAPILDRTDRDAFYQHGWNWWVTDVNSTLEASVQVAGDNRTSYYGGGYTAYFGSRFVMQQEVPLTPPMSIASLSHARLGGWSIANGLGGGGHANVATATGGGGLFPHTLQAIGNSYAHPHLAPDAASGEWETFLRHWQGARTITFADHSYLANKALWDEYYFSSIAPRTTAIYSGSGDGAEDTAREAFFENGHLPNRRLMPIPGSLDEDTFGRFFAGGQINSEGERALAGHLMVRGPFNVNSTSVEAWRAVFSALRGKEVGITSNRGIEGGIAVNTTSTSGTPVSQFSAPNGSPSTGSSPDPGDPEQWRGWRELSDREITQLAEAMVKQVKKRGPFLSVSEFINRRLDRSDKDLALKGALQAALDDNTVDINAGFRSAERRISNVSGMNPAFPEALEGPVAYGSAAYVDQADVLRNMGNELTPRGDTFLIRTYGDSLDGSGNVVARAWCEAVVQRQPRYLDSADDDWEAQEDLESVANKNFGRRFKTVSFRWLNEDEV